MITPLNLFTKRLFDIILSILFIVLLIIPVCVLIVIATLDVKTFGLYSQKRVGQHGKTFTMYKIRTLKEGKHDLSNLNIYASKIGRFLRRKKIDELPQLFNILIGNMSFVGPRPDIVGFADQLKGSDRIILKVKPGLTGPATIKYKHEEQLLSQQDDPEVFNKTIIWKDKVKINKKYVEEWSFLSDLKYLIKTVFD